MQRTLSGTGNPTLWTIIHHNFVNINKPEELERQQTFQWNILRNNCSVYYRH